MKELIPFIHVIFWKIKAEGVLPNLFPMRPDKYTVRKENYRPLYFMNIHVKTHNITIANQIQKCRKVIIYHDQVGFQVCKVDSIKKKSM